MKIIEELIRLNQKNRIIFTCLIIGYLSMFLHLYPEVYIDEPWESITAYQLYFNGTLNNPVLEGRDYYDQHFLQPRILQSVVTGVFFKAFGLSLFAGRLASWLMGLGTLWVLFRLLHFERTSSFLTGMAIVLLTTNHYFFTFSRTIRPEIFVTFIGLLSFFFLYYGIKENRSVGFVLSGLISGLGMWTHPSYTILIIAFGVIFILEYRWKFVLKSYVWIFVCFAFIGFTPYLVYLFSEDFGNGFVHFWTQMKSGAQQGDEGFVGNTFFAEAIRYKQYLSPFRGAIVIIEVFFLILSFRLKDRISQYSRIMIGAHILLLPILIVNNRMARYLLPAIPFLVILIVKILESFECNTLKNCLIAYRQKLLLPKFVFAALVVLTVNQTLAVPIRMVAKQPSDYGQFLQDLREHIPANAKVWGSMMFWFGFSDCDYRTQYTYGRELDTFKPEYVITHDSLLWNRKKKRWNSLIDQIDNYVKQYYIQIAEIDNKTYGKIKIWKRSSTP